MAVYKDHRQKTSHYSHAMAPPVDAPEHREVGVPTDIALLQVARSDLLNQSRCLIGPQKSSDFDRA